MAATRIVMPASATRGGIVRVKALVQHIMETGHRRDSNGQAIARDLVTDLVVTYSGVIVFRAELHPGIAANPYLAFSMRARDSGDVVFRWTGHNGFAAVETRKLVVN